MDSASPDQPAETPLGPVSSSKEVLLKNAIGGESDQKILGQEECDSEYLLFKNTSSFRCLAQVLLSSSSLMKNRLYLFPPLEDPGIDEAFNYKEPSPPVDDTGVEKYVNLCKELEIVPITRIKKYLEGPTLDLKFYGLTYKQLRALTETLKINSYVETLILQDNWLDPDMTNLICAMLEENSALRVLNLRECRIGEKGENSEKTGSE